MMVGLAISCILDLYLTAYIEDIMVVQFACDQFTNNSLTDRLAVVDSSSSDSSSDEEPAKKQEAKVPKSSVTPKSVPKAPVQPKKVALEPKKVGKDSSSSKHQLNVDLYLKPSEKKPPISDVKSSATEEENHSDTTFESEISESVSLQWNW